MADKKTYLVKPFEINSDTSQMYRFLTTVPVYYTNDCSVEQERFNKIVLSISKFAIITKLTKPEFCVDLSKKQANRVSGPGVFFEFGVEVANCFLDTRETFSETGLLEKEILSLPDFNINNFEVNICAIMKF